MEGILNDKAKEKTTKAMSGELPEDHLVMMTTKLEQCKWDR